jgi:hypothetical protein
MRQDAGRFTPAIGAAARAAGRAGWSRALRQALAE